jgi:nitrate reductase (NAD(P)H)
MSGKKFTFEEIAKHNTEKDCWIIVDGKVYQVIFKARERHPAQKPFSFCSLSIA